MEDRTIEKYNQQRVSGDFLRSLREDRHLSQAQLAEILDVSTKTVGRIECGDRGMDGVSIMRASNYFGVTTDEIITGKRKESQPVLVKDKSVLDINELFSQLTPEQQKAKIEEMQALVLLNNTKSA